MRQTSARPGAAVMFGAAPGRGWLRRGRRIGRAAVLAVMACGLAAGCTVAGAPAAHRSPAGAPFVYVTGKGGPNEISQFASLGSGALRPLTPKNVAGGEYPVGIVVSPQGTSAYAVNSLSRTAGAVSQYTLNPATGKLSPKSPRTVPTAAGQPSGNIAVSPDGKNAYVPSGKAISQFRISAATGKLTPMPPRKVPGTRHPSAIKVAPDGRYLYITNGKNCLVRRGSTAKCAHATNKDTVWVFRINPATGALSARPVQIVATAHSPQMITIAPDGKSAYVTGPSAIWQYTVNPATGRLTPKSPATVATGRGSGPHDLAVTSDGKNLYVITAGNATILQYRISPHSGALSARPASTARTVPYPEALALSPDGKNAYVTCQGKGVLSQFAISPVTGKITPLSPATVTAPSRGSLGLTVTP